MPNFDGTGLLKRRRIIWWGQGPCKKCNDGCESQKNLAGVPVKEENNPELFRIRGSYVISIHNRK